MLSIALTMLAVTMALAEPVTQSECVPIEKEIVGKSLEGQLMPGQKVMAVSPACRPIRRMDFVIFRSNESKNLVIKQIWGLPGDTLTVGKMGHVFVNGEQTLTPFDKPYFLKPFFAKKLRKYEGVLAGYLALGHPSSLDSGRVGPISLEDIVGVVEREEGRARKGEDR